MTNASQQSKLPFSPGVFPALVTPFTKDETVDEDAFRGLIRHVIDHVDGLVPCGTTGEFPYLSVEEQRRLVEIAVEEAQGKPVIAGTGAPSTRQAIELAKNAKEAGASACLVVTPYYLHPSDKGIYQHFYELAKAEGFSGPPFFEVAHIDLLLGVKDGPVGKAIRRALDEPRSSHGLLIINERPRTLLVPTVTVRTKKQATHVYEDAARGIKLAIEASIQDGSLPKEALDDLVMIANVFVHPASANRKRIEFNSYKAMRAAIRKAIEGRPTLEELLSEKEAARHPFRYAP